MKMIGLGIGASIALGGVLLKAVGRMSAEKGFGLGAKRIVRHLHEKNKGKETRLSRFLETIVGMSNEELAGIVNERSDDILSAMRTGSDKLDDTGKNLLEMTEQLREMMENYGSMEDRDKKFIQSLRDVIDTDAMAAQITESLKEQQGEQLKAEDIVSELGDMFGKLGWNEKLEKLDARLERIDDDIKRILHRSRRTAGDLSDIKDKLDGIEGIPVGDEETAIHDSVLHRSNVVTAGRDVKIISADNLTNIDASKLDRSVWKDVLSDAIRDLGIDTEIMKVARLEASDQCLTSSPIGRKFEEVTTVYENFDLDGDHLLRLGSSLYLSGEYAKAYRVLRKAMKDREETARENIEVLFSDRNFRDRVLLECRKVRSKLFSNLEELYENGDTRNYRFVKKVHDELSLFVSDVQLSVEGKIEDREKQGSVSGIESQKLERLAVIYEEIMLRINDLCRKSEEIRALIYAGEGEAIRSIAAPMKNDVVSLRNRYMDRTSIIREVL